MPRRQALPAGVYQRPNGQFWGDFRQFSAVGGRREPLKAGPGTRATKDRRQARKLYLQRLTHWEATRALTHQERPPRATNTSGPIVGAQHAVDFLQDQEQALENGLTREGRARQQRTQKGIDDQRRDLERIWRWAASVGKLHMHEIERLDVRALRVHLQEQKLAPASIHKAMMAASAQYRRAKSDSLVKENPFRDNDHVPSAGRRRAAWLEPDKARDFIECASSIRFEKCPYIGALIAFLFYTGARPAEAFGARWADFPLSGGRMTIRGTKNEESEEREQPFWPHLKQILRAHRRTIPADCPYLFPSPIRKGGWRPIKDIRAAFEAVATKAGLPTAGRDRVTPKAARHTWASTMRGLIEGKRGSSYNSLAIANMMGHTSEKTLNKVYTHALRGRLKWTELDYRRAIRLGLPSRRRS